MLLSSFDIQTRTGLLCAPLIHHGLGTHPKGCVRVSLGAFNTPADLDALCAALERVGPR